MHKSEDGLSNLYRAKVDLKEKGVWYRIFTGFFKDREHVEEFRQAHGLTDAIIKMTRYANLLGTYNSLNELEGMVNQLKSLDYSPYVIKYSDATFLLYVGAFYDLERAEKLQRDLESDNMPNEVVER